MIEQADHWRCSRMSIKCIEHTLLLRQIYGALRFTSKMPSGSSRRAPRHAIANVLIRGGCPASYWQTPPCFEEVHGSQNGTIDPFYKLRSALYLLVVYHRSR